MQSDLFSLIIMMAEAQVASDMRFIIQRLNFLVLFYGGSNIVCL